MSPGEEAHAQDGSPPEPPEEHTGPESSGHAGEPTGSGHLDGSATAAEEGRAQGTERGDAGEQVRRLEDQLQRTTADLDNLRKRYARDLARERGAERARLAADWLPVVDNLELALQHTDSDPDAVAEGIRAVHEQAVATMARLGYPPFEAVGADFDPVLHEAVATAVDAEAPEGTVVAVVRPGYGTAESLLRPAGVVVSKG